MSSLGARIREVRTNAGLTQAEFASRIGITQGYLSEVERGVKAIIGSDIVTAIHEEFGISADWLLFELYPFFVEGQKVSDAGSEFVGRAVSAVRDGDAKLSRCEARVAELENENNRLKGQIIAYKDIIQSLKP